MATPLFIMHVSGTLRIVQRCDCFTMILVILRLMLRSTVDFLKLGV